MASNSMWNILLSKINSNKCSTDKNEVTNIVNELIKDKVDSVPGKGLSTNDYTDDDKKKVASALTKEYVCNSPDSWAPTVNITVNEDEMFLVFMASNNGSRPFPRGLFLVSYNGELYVDEIVNTSNNKILHSISDDTVTFSFERDITSFTNVTKIPITL